MLSNYSFEFMLRYFEQAPYLLKLIIVENFTTVECNTIVEIGRVESIKIMISKVVAV